MEFILNNMWLAWLIAAGIFVLLEAVTVSLVSIWFVPGAVLTSIISIWVEDIAVQVVLFILLSAIFLVLCRKFFKKSRPDALDDTTSKLIGKTATAQTDISDTEGQVLLGDVHWRAVSDAPIEAGASVIVTEVNGNLLTVDKK
ncbi:MAG: NfeD family protein [Clostridia bacterium]|nr:NfeD family protein [Clostridia bacterium]